MIDATDTATNGETREAPTLRTPDQILGPYFPTGQVLLARADLTRRPDRVGNAQGEIVEIRGRVFNMRGETVPRANAHDLAGQCVRPLRARQRYQSCAARSEFRGLRSDTIGRRWSLCDQNHQTQGAIRRVPTGHVRRIYISRSKAGSNGS
jgi:hypothetical protein